jgi:Fur family transcriptional regulator, peroxide stress response regulator
MTAEGRLTRYRKAVLETLRSTHDHPTAADVFHLVRRRRPGVAYATIYNALNWLERGGLIARIKLADEAARYDPIVERHDHLVCSSCGALKDVTLRLPSRVWAHVARGTRFRVDGYRTELFGLCARCSAGNAKA